MERQRAMELLDSWIERLLHFLQPNESPHLVITPISLHIPDEVIVLLPPTIRESVQQLISQSFNDDNMNVDDLLVKDLSESTAFLQLFSHEQLQWLLVKMEERLSEMEESEQQRGRVEHPEWTEEWHSGVEGRALAELELESKVLEELQALEEWCDSAVEADADEGLPLDKFVQLAELLVSMAFAEGI